MTGNGRIAVVGASLAGLRAAEALRARGFDGELLVIGEEPYPPYNRPPLSKQFLTTDMAVDELTLPARPDAAVRWLLGCRATRLDRTGRRIATSDGTVTDLDAVVIATGAHARPLPLPELDGIHALRTVPDAVALRASLRRGGRVAVLGAGLIGCEVAASCRQRGIAVSLVDPAPVPMARALPRSAGLRVADLHRAAGVDVRLSTTMTALHGDGRGRVARIELTDGTGSATRLEIDTLVVAVGSRPGTGWLHDSGLDVADGVRTDVDCRAVGGGGRVLAVGDVSRTPVASDGPAERGEHWSRAVEQSARAAHALLGGPPVAAAPSFFWSDQHGRRLQVVGEPHVADAESTEHDGDRWAISYHRRGELVAVAALDLPARIAAARRRVGRAHLATA